MLKKRELDLRGDFKEEGHKISELMQDRRDEGFEVVVGEVVGCCGALEVGFSAGKG